MQQHKAYHQPNNNIRSLWWLFMCSAYINTALGAENAAQTAQKFAAPLSQAAHAAKHEQGCAPITTGMSEAYTSHVSRSLSMMRPSTAVKKGVVAPIACQAHCVSTVQQNDAAKAELLE